MICLCWTGHLTDNKRVQVIGMNVTKQADNNRFIFPLYMLQRCVKGAEFKLYYFVCSGALKKPHFFSLLALARG